MVIIMNTNIKTVLYIYLAMSIFTKYLLLIESTLNRGVLCLLLLLVICSIFDAGLYAIIKYYDDYREQEIKNRD